MNKTLQNHPFTEKFPVRSKWVCTWLLHDKPSFKTRDAVESSLSLFMTVFPILAGFAVIKVADYSEFPQLFRQITVILTAVSLLGLLWMWLIGRRLAKLPVRQQERYYELNRITQPVDAQCRALSLMAVQNYREGQWSETLEDAPLLEQFHNDPLLKNFPHFTRQSYQNWLYQDWGITNREEYQNTFDRLVGSGYHTELFLERFVFNTHAVKNRERLSCVAGIPTETVNAYTEDTPHGTPKLIWGYEWWRAARITRNARNAGFIDDTTAWEKLLRLSSYVHTLFDSFDDFQQNLILGRTVWSDDKMLADESRHDYLLYRENCHWPVRSLTDNWQKDSAVLPESVSALYRQMREDWKNRLAEQEAETAEEQRRPIGFIQPENIRI